MRDTISLKDGAKDKLVRLFKVISWLDDKRWNQERDTFVGKFNSEILNDYDLDPDEKILAHWLIYITNRGKDADALWENNSPIIKNLVKDYRDGKSVSNICVERLYKNTEKGKEKLAIRALPVDVKSIWRTLVVLLDYDKNIVTFMTENVEKWSKDEFTTRLAFRLYLLSYKDIGGKLNKSDVLELLETPRKSEEEVQSIRDILCEKSKFEEGYKVWKSKRWHKRLWAALRDYKKHETLSEIFIKDIEKNKQELWKKNFNEEQLELPGDRWNEKFYEHLIDPIAKVFNVKGKAPPEVVRELWGEIRRKCPKSYPEQFDVSFDLAPRMCEKRLCKVCPFGKDGARSICNPGGKYCLVALFTCGYLAECKEDGCVIKDDVGKGICQERK